MNLSQPSARFLFLMASIVAFTLISSTSVGAHADLATPELQPSEIAYTSHWAMYVMSADGSNPRCVTSCNKATAGQYPSAAPAWSHDGKHIAFKGYRDNPIDHYWQIFVINADGTYLLRLADYDSCTPDNGTDSPSWSPDDSQVAFANCHEGKWGVDVVNVDGSHLKTLVALDDVVSSPKWSPDGQVIAFNLAPLTIAAVNSDGSNLRTLIKNGFSPAWSPDGTQLAFISLPDQAGGASSVSISDADGSHQRTLYQGTNFVDSPTWSPDGQSIAFMAQPDTSNDSYYDGNIYRINADGSNLIQLTQDGGLWPAWSPELK